MTLPVMHLNGRDPARAGVISDASLLDVMTVCADPDFWLDGATPNSIKGLRAGTVAVLTSPDRAASPKNVDEAKGRYCVAIAGSHFNANKFGIYESEQASVDGVTYAPYPANAVNTGRIWLFTKSNAGIVAGSPVAIADSGTSDPVTGWVEKAAAVADAIPGFRFTGRTDKHDGGLTIAEVQIRQQTA